MTSPLPFGSARSQARLGWTALALAWICGLVLAWPGGLHGDEWVHWYQLSLLLKGEYRILGEWLTNIPGYHWLMWALMKPFGTDALGLARILGSLFGLGAVIAFHRIRRDLHPADLQRATAAFVLLPILYPFHFLVYTDVLALALLLAALLAGLRGRHGLAALALVGSMAVRQNNVFWAGGFALLALWPLWRGAGFRIRDVWRESLALAWPYVLAVLAFLAYWGWNGSISWSNAQGAHAHPDVRFDAGNPYYLLFLAALLVPLHVVAGLRRFVAAARLRPAWWLLPPAVFALFALCFRVEHPYNTFEGDVFLRNVLLQAVMRERGPWLGFGIAATLAACGMAFTRFVRDEFRWVLPLSIVFVAASWLIETRYAIVPFVLWLALRRPEADAIERATLAWWGVLAAVIAAGIFDHRFMI